MMTADWGRLDGVVAPGVGGPRLDNVLDELCTARPRISSSFGVPSLEEPSSNADIRWSGTTISGIGWSLSSLLTSGTSVGYRDEVGEGNALEGAVGGDDAHWENWLGEMDDSNEGVETCRLPAPSRSTR